MRAYKYNMKTKLDRKDLLRNAGANLDRMHALISDGLLLHMQSEMRDGDLSFSDLNALLFLNKNGPSSIDRIASHLNLSHPAASRLVERLAKRNFVSRKQSGEDKRQKVVSLASKGKKILFELRSFTAMAYEALLSSLPPDAFAEFSDALENVSAELPPHPFKDF